MFDHRFLGGTGAENMEMQELSRLISNCLFCAQIDSVANSSAPVLCTKFSGSTLPIRVNLNTCLTCGEYQ